MYRRITVVILASAGCATPYQAKGFSAGVPEYSASATSAPMMPAPAMAAASAWWCAAADIGTDYCAQKMSDCEDFRAEMEIRGVTLEACWPRPDAACFQEQYLNGVAAPQCASTLELCNKNRAFVVGNPSVGTALSGCTVVTI